jgi:hypothetical protein
MCVERYCVQHKKCCRERRGISPPVAAPPAGLRHAALEIVAFSLLAAVKAEKRKIKRKIKKRKRSKSKSKSKTPGAVAIRSYSCSYSSSS